MPFGGIKGSALGDFSKGVTNRTFFTQLKVVYTKFTKLLSPFKTIYEEAALSAALSLINRIKFIIEI